MKRIFILTILGISILTSCSNSDNNISDSTDTYFPLAIGNFWTYNVESAVASGRDSLYIKKDTLINAKIYRKLKTKNIPSGFYSNTLNNNSIRKDGDKILLTGESGINFTTLIPIDLSLSDFIIFKENTTANEQLSAVSGTINQVVNNFPLKIEYTLKSVGQASLANYTTAKGVVYQEVKPVKIVLNLKISTVVSVAGFSLPVPLLNAQDVIASTQYYAKNIGMVYCKTTISYQLQNFSQFNIQLPIPQSGNEVQEEVLDKYSVD